MMKSAIDTASFKMEHYDPFEKGYIEKQSEIWKTEAKHFGVQESRLLDIYEA